MKIVESFLEEHNSACFKYLSMGPQVMRTFNCLYIPFWGMSHISHLGVGKGVVGRRQLLLCAQAAFTLLSAPSSDTHKFCGNLLFYSSQLCELGLHTIQQPALFLHRNSGAQAWEWDLDSRTPSDEFKFCFYHFLYVCLWEITPLSSFSHLFKVENSTTYLIKLMWGLAKFKCSEQGKLANIIITGSSIFNGA